MRTRQKKLLAFLLALTMLVSALILPVSAAGYVGGSNVEVASGSSSSGGSSISDISQILNAKSYSEYRAAYESKGPGQGQIVINGVDYDKFVVDGEEKDLETETEEGNVTYVTVPESGTITWTFDVEHEGNYIIEIEYRQVNSKNGGGTSSIERVFYLNGEVPFSQARSVVLSKVWQYRYEYDIEGNKTFKPDNNGNDIRPDVVEKPEWVKYAISDSNGYVVHPFQFFLEKGTNEIALESQREKVEIKSITLRPYEELITYEEYLKIHGTPNEENRVSGDAFLEMNAGTKYEGNNFIIIEAEAPDKVSASTMYPVYDRTSSLTSGLTGPQSAVVTKYNTAGKEQWQTVGEWMTYNITVPKDGYYSIAVRYKQSLLSGMFVTRKLYIDGFVPFEEANNCRFPFTGSWSSIYLGDGTHEFEFYLTAGTHEIKLEAALGSDMGALIEKVSNSLSVINSCYLEIIKLTGSDPDTNVDYEFSRVMQDVLDDMFDQFVVLKGVYRDLVAVSGPGEKTATIEQIYLLLEKMAKDETQIAKNLATLKTHIGSLGTWINSAKTQPLQVDFYGIQPKENPLPRGDGNFFETFWYEIQLFFASFRIDYNNIGGAGNEVAYNNNVEVWVATGRDQAQIIRNLITNEMNEGISVSLKLIAGGTLLPSVLAGVGPDVSLMEASTTAIDYALRDAVLPLNEFIEADLAKGEDVLAAFPDAAMVPLSLYDYNMHTDETTVSYYGLPDSLTFPMMFYRKDVLASINKDYPRTWDDMLAILPVLQYNNMEIGIQNDIYTFIYQSGNKAYSNHGMTINFDSQGVLNAFTKMCDMYTQYSLPYTFDFANRFRTGEMPIGIAPYTTCNQLAVFASELSGLWTFVELPGYEVYDDLGNPVIDEKTGKTQIRNSSIATVTACIMLSGCKEDNRENAWTFMKWYTGAAVQEKYANAVVSIMGIAARPATANKEALESLPWTSEELKNIKKQFEKLDSVENHPGSYYLARYVSFAFLAAYNEGKDPADALLGYTNTINAELERRRQEFQNRYTDNEDEKKYMYTIEEYEAYLLSEDYQSFLANLKSDSIEKYNKHLVEETFAYYITLLEKDDEKLKEFMLSSLYTEYLTALKAQIDKAGTRAELQLAQAKYYAFLIGKLHGKFITEVNEVEAKLDAYLVSEFYSDYVYALRISNDVDYHDYLIGDTHERFFSLFEGNENKYDEHLVTECYLDYLSMLKRTDAESYKAHLTGKIYAHLLAILASEGNEQQRAEHEASEYYQDYLDYQG